MNLEIETGIVQRLLYAYYLFYMQSDIMHM